MKSCHSLRSQAVYIAFVIFGLASFIMANGLFVEVAALYRRVPEGKALSAYMIVAMQASNIFPVLYMMFNSDQQRFSVTKTIWCVLLVGMVVCVLVAFLWMETTLIFGKPHSAVFLFLVFAGGMVSSMTSVVFYSFVSQFPTIYTSALATGEGCGGGVAALLGLLQDSGGDQLRFSINAYFLLNGAVFVASSIAFGFLLYHPWAHEERLKLYDEDIENDLKTPTNQELTPLCEDTPKLYETVDEEQSGNATVDKIALLKLVWKPLAIQWWLCTFAFGIVPSILPYLCGGYINESRVLMFSSILSMSSDPLGRFLTSFWRWYHLESLNVMVTILVGFIIYEAVFTKHHPFMQYEYGGIFPVAANCIYVFCFAFTQTMIYLTLKNEVHGKSEHARITYQWSGFLTQLGGLTGTLIIFPFVTFSNFFAN